MPSFDGRDTEDESSLHGRYGDPGRDVAVLLFDSLAHHLMEKGLLTKNDCLSIVQTVAQVKQGQLDAVLGDSIINSELAHLRRLYESFEALRENPIKYAQGNHDNVRQLRPPLHEDVPKYPVED